MMGRLWARLDPRVQGLLALGLSVAALLAPYPRVLILAVWCWIMALSTLPTPSLRALLRSVIFLGGITILLGAWLSGNRNPDLPWFEPTWSGTILGAIQATRISALAAVMAWAVSSVSVWKLSQRVEWTLRHRSSLRIGFHRLAFPVILAWTMVPGLWDETGRQIEVAKLREGPTGRGWSLRRLRTLIPSWFHGMALRAETLSEALTLRGYQANLPPRVSGPFRLGMVDYCCLIILVLVVWASAL